VRNHSLKASKETLAGAVQLARTFADAGLPLLAPRGLRLLVVPVQPPAGAIRLSGAKRFCLPHIAMPQVARWHHFVYTMRLLTRLPQSRYWSLFELLSIPAAIPFRDETSARLGDGR
jgi:hypothetical protein